MRQLEDWKQDMKTRSEKEKNRQGEGAGGVGKENEKEKKRRRKVSARLESMNAANARSSGMHAGPHG